MLGTDLAQIGEYAYYADDDPETNPYVLEPIRSTTISQPLPHIDGVADGSSNNDSGEAKINSVLFSLIILYFLFNTQ